MCVEDVNREQEGCEQAPPMKLARSGLLCRMLLQFAHRGRIPSSLQAEQPPVWVRAALWHAGMRSGARRLQAPCCSAQARHVGDIDRTRSPLPAAQQRSGKKFDLGLRWACAAASLVTEDPPCNSYDTCCVQDIATEPKNITMRL